MLIKSFFTKLGKYHKHMQQINAEIYFKSVNEKRALNFQISTVWHEVINEELSVFACVKLKFRQ